MGNFKLKIVESKGVFFDGECQSLTVPYVDGGSMGFLAHHENCVMPIEAGEMKIIAANGEETDAFVGDGFLEFINNEAVLVCASALRPEDIDLEWAQRTKEQFEEELRQKQSRMEYIESKAGLARAMERIKVKNRHSI